MLKLAIVDDEAFSRMDIKSAVDFSELGLSCIWEAANGRDALERMTASCPDILLLDVIMPEMDGIETLQQIMKLPFPPKVIMLSCHDEYLFVREAMKLGAEDYVLKQSLNKGELAAVLSRTAEKIQTEIKKGKWRGGRESLHKSWLGRSLTEASGWCEETGRDPLWIERFGKEGYYVIYLDLHPVKHNNRKIIVELIEQIFLEYKGSICLETESLGETVILCIPENDSLAEQIAVQIDHFFSLYFNARVAIGIHRHTFGIENIHSSYKSAKRMTEHYFYAVSEGRGECIYPAWRYPALTQKISEEAIKKSETLSAMLEYGQKSEIWTRWQELNAMLFKERLRPGKLKERNIEWIYAFIRKRCDTYTQEMEDSICADIVEMETLEKLNFYICTLLDQLWDFMQKNDRQIRSEISLCIQYIAEHYSENLSLTLMAKKTNLGSNYFGALFKKEMGVSLTDYINTVRIERAKEFLAAGYQVQEITYMAGYNSISYFSRLFKRMTGITPKEYAERSRIDYDNKKDNVP